MHLSYQSTLSVIANKCTGSAFISCNKRCSLIGRICLSHSTGCISIEIQACDVLQICHALVVALLRWTRVLVIKPTTVIPWLTSDPANEFFG